MKPRKQKEVSSHPDREETMRAFQKAKSGKKKKRKSEGLTMEEILLFDAIDL